MTQPLFRPAAVAARAASGLQVPSIAGPPKNGWIALLTLATAAGFVALLFLGRYTMRETLVGQLTTNSHVQVYAQAHGRIALLNVADGAFVEKGDPLAYLQTGDPTTATGMLALLQEEAASLTGQQRSAEARYRHQSESLARRLENARAQQAMLEQQRRNAGSRLRLSQSEVDRTEVLQAKGLVAAIDAERTRERFLDAEWQVITIDREIASHLNTIAELDSALQRLPLDRDAELEALQIEGQRLRQRKLGLHRNTSHTLTAPITGTVNTLTGRVGQQVVPSTALLTILPAKHGLVAEFVVPGRAIGYLEAGAELQLRFDAFPFERHGIFPARVTSISSTIVKPQAVDAAHLVAQPGFLAHARLQTDHVDVDGESVHLKAGMTLRAEVARDRRRLVAWLFGSVFEALDRAG